MKKLLLLIAMAALTGIAKSHAQIIYSENFESVTIPSIPSSWTNVHTGAGGQGWQTSASTVSFYSGYFVMPAHTKYALVNEGNIPFNYPAKATTPTFSLAGTSHAYLSYDVWFTGTAIGSAGRQEQAWVELSTDGGTTYATIDTIGGSTTGWRFKFVTLTATSANCKLRFVYTDNRTSTDTAALVGMGIDNIKVADANTNDIAITAITPVTGDVTNDYGAIGTGITIGGTAYNAGYTTITSFSATYRVGFSGPVTSTITATIPPYTFYAFSCPTPYTVTSVGVQQVQLNLVISGDTAHYNDTLRTTITGTSFTPVKKLFYEQAVGTWAGWSPRSIVFMDSLWRLDSNNVAISAVHNSDPMATENTLTTHYDAYLSGIIPGYPAQRVDRKITDDPSNCITDYYSMINNFGFADLYLSAAFTSGALHVNCAAKPALDLTGDYRLELIVTERYVHGSASGYNQRNYYSGSTSGAMATVGYDFITLPGTVPAASMYYQFVDRYTVPDMTSSPNGVAGSLPSAMYADSTYNYSFSAISIPSTWNVANFEIIGLLIDNNSTSPTFGQVLNSVNTSIGATSVTSLCVGATDTLTPPSSGGYWSSSIPAIATVDATSGIVTGVAGGTAIMTYTSSAGIFTTTVTVLTAPNPGTIYGSATACTGTTLTLTDSVAGGTWSSSNPSVATINSSGIVTTLSAGTTTITYSVTNSCGTSIAVHTITVAATATAGTITGAAMVCAGATVPYTNTTTGGTWSSSNPSVATINASTGIVTGVTAGSAIITYSVSLSCGTAITTAAITVNAVTVSGAITGASPICAGTTSGFTSTVTGGTWSTSNASVASVSNTGTVTAVAAGTAAISYSVTGICGTVSSTMNVTVEVMPSAGTITGHDTVCQGNTIAQFDTVTSGTWYCNPTSVATITATGAVTGVAAGTAIVTYNVTNSCGTVTARHNVVVLPLSACPSGVTSATVTENIAIVYPNPNTGIFTLEIPGISNLTTITVQDIYGKTIKTYTIYPKNGLKQTIDLNLFARGTYFIKAENEGISYREKVTVL